MANISDTVDVYQELLATIWKEHIKSELPEDISLHLGELKHKIEQFPLTKTEVDSKLLE